MRWTRLPSFVVLSALLAIAQLAAQTASAADKYKIFLTHELYRQ